jgi:hypothetical protein
MKLDIWQEQEFLKCIKAGATFDDLLQKYDHSEVTRILDKFDYWDRTKGAIRKVDAVEDTAVDELEPVAEVLPDEDDGDEMPELLPFPDAPAYDLDSWGIPHTRKRRGTPAKKMRPNRFQKKGNKKWVTNYRLRTPDGERSPFQPRYLLIARTIAERKWKAENGGES